MQNILNILFNEHSEQFGSNWFCNVGRYTLEVNLAHQSLDGYQCLIGASASVVKKPKQSTCTQITHIYLFEKKKLKTKWKHNCFTSGQWKRLLKITLKSRITIRRLCDRKTKFPIWKNSTNRGLGLKLRSLGMFSYCHTYLKRYKLTTLGH